MYARKLIAAARNRMSTAAAAVRQRFRICMVFVSEPPSDFDFRVPANSEHRWFRADQRAKGRVAVKGAGGEAGELLDGAENADAEAGQDLAEMVCARQQTDSNLHRSDILS